MGDDIEEKLFQVQQALDPVLPKMKYTNRTLRVQILEEDGRWSLKVGNLTGHQEDDRWEHEWEGDSFRELLDQIEKSVPVG